MNLKKSVIWFVKLLLFLIMLAGFIGSVVSAVITVVPDSSASKINMLGYKSHCSFMPISTIIPFITALVFGLLFMRMYGKKIPQFVRTKVAILGMIK